MSDQEENEDYAGDEGGDEGEAAEPEEKIPERSLDLAGIKGGLSLLCRSGNGLDFAYVKLEARGSDGRQLTDIEILKEYSHLRYIDLSGNLLTTIRPLNGIPELSTLDVSGNKLTAVDLGPTSYLQIANFSGNKINSVDGMNHVLLKNLNFNENSLDNVSALTSTTVPALEVLSLANNKLTSIASVVLPNLVDLTLSGNEIESLAGIGTLTSLQRLHVDGNKITSVDGFDASQTKLSYINLGGNNIEDLSEAKNIGILEGLQHLVLVDNPVAENPEYRPEMLVAIINMVQLDEDRYEDEERKEAAGLREKRKLEAIEAKEAAEAEAKAAEEARVKAEEDAKAAAAAEAQKAEEAKAHAAAEVVTTNDDLVADGDGEAVLDDDAIAAIPTKGGNVTSVDESAGEAEDIIDNTNQQSQ